MEHLINECDIHSSLSMFLLATMWVLSGACLSIISINFLLKDMYAMLMVNW